MTADDIPAWRRLLTDVEAVDHTGEYYSEEDLAHELANPDIVVGKDVVGCFDGDLLVGYFKIYPRGEADGVYKVIVEATVLPERRGRGIGSHMVGPMLDRAREAHREKTSTLPLKLMLTGLTRDVEQEKLLATVGLLPERWSFVMRVDLADLPDPGEFPAGYRSRRYEPSMADALLAAHNDAFLDHPNSTPWTDVMWKQWVVDSPSSRPDVSFVVEPTDAPGEIAAYLQTDEFEAYQEATGRREAYVARLGTARPHRRRGLAEAMLRHALHAFRAAGYDEASLVVDSANPTGALGVYERSGFRVETRFTDYSRVIAAS
jgi:mycothiol synthase